MDINNYEVIFTENAKEEMDKIYKYISENLVLKVFADSLMEKIEHKVLRLEQFPHSCEVIHIKPRNEKYRKLRIDNYIALYRIDENQRKVNIIHILSTKQNYLM